MARVARGSRQGKAVQIVVGLVVRGERVLVCRRPSGSHLEGTWEFPGGKVGPEESLEDALDREMQEEVSLECSNPVLFHRQEYSYPERTVLISYFFCREARGEPVPREGQEMRWVDGRELRQLETPKANREVIALLAQLE